MHQPKSSNLKSRPRIQEAANPHESRSIRLLIHYKIATNSRFFHILPARRWREAPHERGFLPSTPDVATMSSQTQLTVANSILHLPGNAVSDGLSVIRTINVSGSPGNGCVVFAFNSKLNIARSGSTVFLVLR